MKRATSDDFMFSIFSLLISFVLVHAAYVTAVRPKARTFLLEQRQMMEVNPDYEPEDSLYVLIKDYEQEACFVLMFAAMAILGYKGWSVRRENKQLDLDYIGIPDDEYITVPQARSIAHRIDQMLGKRRDRLLPRTLIGAMERFVSTGNVHDASTEAQNLCDEESNRLDSELSTIRYIAWAIPSIGFIGTVRGIGQALSKAHQAVDGDLTGVTESLGIAFNSTLIALVISIGLMLIIHRVQLIQERLALDAKRYCDIHLIRKLTATENRSTGLTTHVQS